MKVLRVKVVQPHPVVWYALVQEDRVQMAEILSHIVAGLNRQSDPREERERCKTKIIVFYSIKVSI